MLTDDSPKKPRKGRPPVDAEAVNVRLPREMLEALDRYRKGQDDLPTRPEAIRRLLIGALESPAMGDDAFSRIR